MRISVTRKDIKNGECGDGKRCAVAVSIRRYFPNQYVHVGTMFIGVGPKVARTSKKVMKFVEAFDRGQPVKPMSFNLVLRKSLTKNSL